MKIACYIGDPDFQYLALDRRRMPEDHTAYDPKSSCWIADPKEGYVRANVIASKGDHVTVVTDKGDEKTIKKDTIQQMNPPKFEKLEDMADLTYLNEASVLHNLRSRYCSGYIYTYSGLFCVVINPYRRLPIYSANVVRKYRSKRRSEMPPHLFAIADNAYSNMLVDRENQSMLITGESGAGKTENTKKVISYFALVAAAGSMKDQEDLAAKKRGTLEDQIVQANPALEAYGNAKTVRNNNSSRFGKFVRIHFGVNGKIAGADIESYLLEKSRVTFQQPGLERNYHIFYWLLSNRYPHFADKLLVKMDPSLYYFINQGCLTVDNMNDGDEMEIVEQSFHVLGFDDAERISLYKCTAAVLLFGEMKFKQRPREEQAEADGTADAEKVAFLLGVNCSDMLRSLMTPKVKVGSEYVTKGQSKDQVVYSVAALAKALYGRMFVWLVSRINRTLDTNSKRQYFIGVLDIAGFEIFEYNTFEQLCINYTNERLQQFFNHHMFVLEQEEYTKEGITWEFIDFGMDLQLCIDLIEKPMGILSILEEECMFPKASDKTFLAKLYENHFNKSKNFGKPKPAKAAKYEPHFEIYHYAGTVQYNINGWLDKNKDPLQECVVHLMQDSKEPLVAAFFREGIETDPSAKKKKKGTAYQTISATHREQLAKLVAILHHTRPSFVRCIIPNEQKLPGVLDANLVMQQLQCNGVLEGIRICRKGFPNRMNFLDFKQRYIILAPTAVPSGFVDAKKVTEKILETLNLGDDFRIGHTKVFFKAGVLGQLEEMREEKLTKTFSYFQAYIRGSLIRKNYTTLLDQRVALSVIQRNIRRWICLRTWHWWTLYTRVKPLLNQARAEDEMRKLTENYETLKKELERVTKKMKDVEEQSVVLQKQKNEMSTQIQAEEATIADLEEKIAMLISQKADLDDEVRELETRLHALEGGSEDLLMRLRAKEEENEGFKRSIDLLEVTLKKADQEREIQELQVKTLDIKLAEQEEVTCRVSKEKRGLEDVIRKLQTEVTIEQEKVTNLNSVKDKLELIINEVQENLDHEKKLRSDVEKAKRKLENDLKATQDTVDELESIKRSLEDNIKRKDQELNGMNAKHEADQSLIAQLQKRIKELQTRISELEEQLSSEKSSRIKNEKQRAELQRELDDLSRRLEEAGGATQAQVDVNRKREAELQKLRRDLEEARVQSEVQAASYRKKQQDAVQELLEQLENAQKAKQKLEKEKTQHLTEISDLRGQIDLFAKSKMNAEKVAKQFEKQLAEVNAKLEMAQRELQELTAVKTRGQITATELNHKLGEAECQVIELDKTKQALVKSLEEARTALEVESRLRLKVQSEARILHSDINQLREQLEEERKGKADLQRMLTKSNSDMAMWKQRFEGKPGGVKSEELEELKKKLNTKLQETESQLEAALSKAAGFEKSNSRLKAKLEDMSIEVERANSLASRADKRQRGFDKVIDEWKLKVADMEAELQRSRADNRLIAADVYKFKGQLDESNNSMEMIRRENNNLNDQIRHLTSQLGKDGRSAHEFEKTKRRIEIERTQLQIAFNEAKAALEQESGKYSRLQLEFGALRQEVDRRIAEKDEEFDITRKNHQRALESMQASFDAEVHGKAEALRNKKKLEQNIKELESSLEAANRLRAEGEKSSKKFQLQIISIQQILESERKSREEAHEHIILLERRSVANAGELEELRKLLEAAEKARKTTESELHEATERISELISNVGSLNTQKRMMENDIRGMQSDLEDYISQLKNAEDDVKKYVADITHLSDELRQEKDNLSQSEKQRRGLESQIKDLQVRLDEAELIAGKDGIKMKKKMEQRVRELEADLVAERRRYLESERAAKRHEKRVRELVFQTEEFQTTNEQYKETIEQLHQKLQSYKRQVDDAEEVASMNLAKFRKVQQELEESESRAEEAETMISRMRSKSRSSSVGGTGSGVIHREKRSEKNHVLSNH